MAQSREGGEFEYPKLSRLVNLSGFILPVGTENLYKQLFYKLQSKSKDKISLFYVNILFRFSENLQRIFAKILYYMSNKNFRQIFCKKIILLIKFVMSDGKIIKNNVSQNQTVMTFLRQFSPLFKKLRKFHKFSQIFS